MKDIREWPLNILFSMSTENKECHLQISDSELPLIRKFFLTQNTSLKSRFRAQSLVLRAAWMERTPVCESKGGSQEQTLRQRTTLRYRYFRMSYLRAEFVPNSMS